MFDAVFVEGYAYLALESNTRYVVPFNLFFLFSSLIWYSEQRYDIGKSDIFSSYLMGKEVGHKEHVISRPPPPPIQTCI